MVFFFLLSFLPIHVNAQRQTLTVIIREVKNNKGVVRVALYNAEKEFMKTMWQSRSAKAKPGEVQTVFEDIPPGIYAISAIHDANENDKLDTNAAGIPKEGFGFSNNAVRMFGPPTFEEAKFVWDGQKKIEITLKYH